MTRNRGDHHAVAVREDGSKWLRDALFNSDTFPTVVAVPLKWAEVEKEQAEFVTRVTKKSLEKCSLLFSALYILALFAYGATDPFAEAAPLQRYRVEQNFIGVGR